MARKTEVRLVCDLCGQRSPVLEKDQPPIGWVHLAHINGQGWLDRQKDFCCENHKYQWIEEHAESLLQS